MPTFSSSISSQSNLWQPCGPSPVLGRTHGPNYPRSAWLIHSHSQPHPNTKAPSVTKLLNGINPVPTMCSPAWLPSNTCSIIACRPSAGPFQRCLFPASYKLPLSLCCGRSWAPGLRTPEHLSSHRPSCKGERKLSWSGTQSWDTW